jgi:O-succinylbenzoic acid--CoA ligase
MTRNLVGLSCPPGPELLTVWEPALAAALDGSGPALVPVPDGPAGAAVREMAQLDVPLERDDVALVVPTSGSTGTPKGSMLTAAALRASGAATYERIGGPGSWLLALPVTHIAGQQVLIRSLLAGRSPVVQDLTGGFTAEGFAAATARLPAADRRYTSLVPTQLARLLDVSDGSDAADAGRDALRSFDSVLLGGAAAPPSLLDRARAAEVRVVTTYGMSETCGGCVYDGLPLPGVRVRLADGGSAEAGRIELGGEVVFAGYRLHPDLDAEALTEDADGRWHVTRDLGRMLDGRLQIDGRVDDLINTGGEKVAPLSVEAALATLETVRDAAVVGRRDETWGQRVVAVVVPQDPAQPPTLDELRTALRDRLPVAALPRELRLVSELPYLASGKPDRTRLRADPA